MILPWTLMSSEMVFDHRWYKLRRDTVKLPDGRVVDDYFVSQRPSVAIAVPITTENKLILVRQYKHGVQAITLEFPAGTFRSESPVTAAARELEEETGYSPSSMMDLGTCFDDSSKNSNLVHIFLASGCQLTGKQRLDELEAASGVEVVLMSLQEVIKALEDGEIKSMSSVAAGYKALRAIGA
ncbi:NUDIX hydrolase [Bradyrhizobium sp. AUGA SZCCT0222]|uniref:NUDIX hydrolase n=1 Tax=Bradyrhizobium sp. AUGA SZCCT0222 TaxID=2807668 RepID=UPI001BAC8BB7|nr:NUDIX hydrolase [Bradyrhizobium sp. AUGA SZCCT0222]MBR1268833.1 NUDIX hydrolase [Bradyrhizobium sp. AUGA SZCCT0222]